MTVRAIIQARLGSTRLPGKVLRPLGERSVLGHVIRRAQACTRIDDVVVATTTEPTDDPVVAESQRYGAGVARGSEHDVLARFHDAAGDATTIVRITSDCPLLDPFVIDAMLERFEQERAAGRPLRYLSNGIVRTFPRGLDAEVFTADALDEAHREAREAYEREHVTPFMYRRFPAEALSSFEQSPDRSGLRWTLDTEDDYRFFQAVFAARPDLDVVLDQAAVLAVLADNPEIAMLNAHVEQKVLPA